MMSTMLEVKKSRTEIDEFIKVTWKDYEGYYEFKIRF